MIEKFRLSIDIKDTQNVKGMQSEVNMISFGGTCEGPLFQGHILPGGVDTQIYPVTGSGTLSARYMMEGKDYTGADCRLFIDNGAIFRKDAETVTHPRIVTNSKALQYLEHTQLTGKILNENGRLIISLYNEETSAVQPITFQRAGLTLHGRIERKTDKPCPLVLLLHGFGWRMAVSQDEWMQQISDRLTDMGYATLQFDFSGHGQSDGDMRDLTIWGEIEDASAALQVALSLPWVTGISVVGHSMGGVVGGMLSGLYPDIIQKAVLICPAASLKDDALAGRCFAASYNPQAIPPLVNIGNDRILGGLYFREAQCLPIYQTTALFKGEMLLLCGGLDDLVLEERIRAYLNGNDNRRFIRYDKLGHGMDNDPAEMKAMVQTIVQFLSITNNEAR